MGTIVETCPTCGQFIIQESVTVYYWEKDTWPYSIDDKPSAGAELKSMEVPLAEVRERGGRRYYRMVSGHGNYTDLLVER